MEIDLKRLLHRLQGAMSTEAHSALSEDEALRRWALVEHAKELLNGLNSNDEDEEVAHRKQLYEAKLKFITDFMLASEGVRPGLHTSPLPEDATVRETKDDEGDMRTQLLIQEERFTRQDLFNEPHRTIPSEAELRRQLGLGQRTTIQYGEEGKDFNQQLEQQGRERESVTNDIINLLGSIRDNSLDVQSSLEKDHKRLDGLATSLEANSGNLAQEMHRMGQLYLSTSQSCRTSCAMVLAALGIFFFSFLVLKLTPRPV
ncbi:hypothetical protein BASA81_002392 [Batrachochytrium salamandrivorans]|nr:hypothetical protein BASA81_002392 [Batrachochytrium salamandrivorans]